MAQAARPGKPAVHPHARGEHFLMMPAELRARGSSPRTWGTPDQEQDEGREGRFIPTHVGNTTRRPRRHHLETVHPHARGEHLIPHHLGMRSAGSSPRTWGTRWAWWFAQTSPRFIPTHVGNTVAARPEVSRPAVHPHARGEHLRLLLRLRSLAGSSPRTWGTPCCDLADCG